MNMEFERKLEIPMKVKEMYPLSKDMCEIVERKRAELCALFEGKAPGSLEASMPVKK
ncbi:MAG: hypothetical protein J6P07_07205 [Spirochaetaceae bacterium]|nr:hypothetical protein [Spirochaetaceae bacterium]